MYVLCLFQDKENAVKLSTNLVPDLATFAKPRTTVLPEALSSDSQNVETSTSTMTTNYANDYEMTDGIDEITIVSENKKMFDIFTSVAVFVSLLVLLIFIILIYVHKELFVACCKKCNCDCCRLVLYCLLNKCACKRSTLPRSFNNPAYGYGGYPRVDQSGF